MRRTFGIALVFSVFAFFFAGVAYVLQALRDRPEPVATPTPVAIEPTVASQLPGSELMPVLCGDSSLRMERDAPTCDLDPCGNGASSAVSLSRFYRGSFSAAGVEEAVFDLDMECASHADGFGGWALLRKEGSAWNRVTLQAGHRPGGCAVVRDDARDLLVCETGWTGHGESVSNLSLRTLVGSELQETQVIMRASENSGAICQTLADSFTWKVDGRALSVSYVKSRAKADVSPSEECEAAPERETTHHSFHFLLEGGKFAVSPEGREAYEKLAAEWEE